MSVFDRIAHNAWNELEKIRHETSYRFVQIERVERYGHMVALLRKLKAAGAFDV